VPGNEIGLASISPVLFANVEAHLGRWVVPNLRQRWPHFAWNGIHDAFVIKYAARRRQELSVHHDVAQISGSVRLNDGYTGGALMFKRQGFDNSKVPVGRLLVWPSLVTHPHHATPVDRGVRYGLTIWFALPGATR